MFVFAALSHWFQPRAAANPTVTAAASEGAAAGPSPTPPSNPGALPVLAPQARTSALGPRLSADPGAAAAVVDTQAGQLGAELVQARRQGVFGLLRWRFEAWLEMRLKDATLTKLTVRREVLEAQQKTTEAEIKLSSTVKSGQKEVERHQIEWNGLRRDRLVSDLERTCTALAAQDGTLLAPTILGSGATSSAKPVSVHVSDEQIEQLALRAFVNLGPAGENEDEWARYKADLHQHLPPYVAQEVERQVEKLRRQAAH